PRWLIANGNVGKAKSILQKIAADSDEEVRLIQLSIARTAQSSISDLAKPGVVFLVILGMTFAIFQQISGANAVFFYAPIIFERAGMNVNDQLFQQILIGSVNLVFTLVAMQLVDRLGRKKLMLGGSSLMAFWLAMVGICFYFSLFGYWLSFFVLAFIATYAMTLAPVTWVLISEIFPTKIRGIAVSVATGTLWVACFMLTYGF